MSFFIRVFRFVFAVAALSTCVLPIATSSAQSKVNKDEDVMVRTFRDWVEGTVIDTKGKQVLVEYFSSTSTEQKVFSRHDVRKLNEVDAMDFSRTWRSAEGSFSVDAAMKSHKDGTVTLIKEDLAEISIELDKLSTRDNGYVKKFVKARERAIRQGLIPAPTPPLPEMQQFGSDIGSLRFYGVTLKMESGETKTRPLEPLPAYLKTFQQNGAGLRFPRFHQNMAAIIPIGGPEQLVLMTTTERLSTEFPSMSYWISLKTGKVTGHVPVTPRHWPLDYHPRYRLLLTYCPDYRTGDGETVPDSLTIWSLKAGAAEAEPIVRWEIEGDEMGIFQDNFAKVVNSECVVVKTDRHTYTGWNFRTGEETFRVEPESFFDAPVVISNDRKHLLIPEDGAVKVIDSVTGDLVMDLEVDARHVSGVNVNPAGTKLAAITESNIYVWDLASGSDIPQVYSAPLMGSPFSSRVEWIDDDHLLGQGSRNRTLFRLSLGLPVWTYRMDVHEYFLNRDPLKNMVVNGMFFYVAEPEHQSMAVGAVELPGPGVAEATAGVDRESLLILRQGTPVSIVTHNVSDPVQVKDWLTEKVEDAGWTVDDSSSVQLIASMGLGDSTTVKYRRDGLRDGQIDQASFQPHFANLKIMDGEVVIWQTGTSTGPPPFISGDINAALAPYQTPQLDFFRRVSLKPDILDPKYGGGFGVSELGLRGIKVVASSPPGRDNDPAAAAEKAAQDLKEAAEKTPDQSTEGDDPEASDGFGSADE